MLYFNESIQNLLNVIHKNIPVIFDDEIATLPHRFLKYIDRLGGIVDLGLFDIFFLFSQTILTYLLLKSIVYHFQLKQNDIIVQYF